MSGKQPLGYWDIEPARQGRGEILCVGSSRVPLRDVRDVAMGEVRESDALGKLVSFALFIGIAGLLCLGVALGARHRLLIGACVVGMIGMCSLFELIGLGKARFFRVVIGLGGGRELAFSTPSKDLAEGLAVAVQRRLDARAHAAAPARSA